MSMHCKTLLQLVQVTIHIGMVLIFVPITMLAFMPSQIVVNDITQTTFSYAYQQTQSSFVIGQKTECNASIMSLKWTIPSCLLKCNSSNCGLSSKNSSGYSWVYKYDNIYYYSTDQILNDVNSSNALVHNSALPPLYAYLYDNNTLTPIYYFITPISSNDCKSIFNQFGTSLNEFFEDNFTNHLLPIRFLWYNYLAFFICYSILIGLRIFYSISEKYQSKSHRSKPGFNQYFRNQLLVLFFILIGLQLAISIKGIIYKVNMDNSISQLRGFVDRCFLQNQRSIINDITITSDGFSIIFIYFLIMFLFIMVAQVVLMLIIRIGQWKYNQMKDQQQEQQQTSHRFIEMRQIEA